MHSFFNTAARTPRESDANSKSDKLSRTSKTYKFVSTMKLKGASVKRAIISNIKSNPTTASQRPQISDYTLPSPVKDQKIVCDLAVKVVALSNSNSVSMSSTNSMSALALVQAPLTDVLKTAPQQPLITDTSNFKESDKDKTLVQ
jgi:hypothetical protein